MVKITVFVINITKPRVNSLGTPWHHHFNQQHCGRWDSPKSRDASGLGEHSGDEKWRGTE